MAQGSVYIIKCGDFPYYKIGSTASAPLARLAALQTAVPFRLELIAWAEVSDILEAEAKLHARYDLQRIRGEWFYFNAKRLATVLEDYLVLDEIEWAVGEVCHALKPLAEIDAERQAKVELV